MITVIDLIRIAQKASGVIGVGQTADFEDTNDCLILLRAMIGGWSRKRWLVYHLVDVAHICNGATSYTVGKGGDFNVARPDQIESAFVRLLASSTSMDVPMTVIPSYEDFGNLSLKTLVSFPMAVYYDASFPLGKLHVYPVPQPGMYEIHLILKETLPELTSLTMEINLPPEYLDALIWTLAVRIRPIYQLPPDPAIIGLSNIALNTLRGANAQIGRLDMPGGMPGFGAGGRWAGHGLPGYGTVS